MNFIFWTLWQLDNFSSMCHWSILLSASLYFPSHVLASVLCTWICFQWFPCTRRNQNYFTACDFSFLNCFKQLIIYCIFQNDQRRRFWELPTQRFIFVHDRKQCPDMVIAHSVLLLKYQAVYHTDRENYKELTRKYF